jgi:type III pantothenate kinase
MLLAIDIGNTNIVFGIHDGMSWKHTWRAQTVLERMPDEYALFFRSFLEEEDIAFEALDQVVLGSVVPQLTAGLAGMVETQTGLAPIVVSHRLVTGINIGIPNPAELGSDLIANAVAAYERCRSACIIVDFGTATTLTGVDSGGTLRGVAISAGLRTIHNALVENTAQLPAIPLAPPPSVLGTDTVTAMQAGLVMGHLALVEGLVQRIQNELGSACVLATGGLATTLAPHTTCFDIVDPWLTLDGLRLIALRQP